MNSSRPTDCMVLLSGGIDSATVLALAASEGLGVATLHITYGQASAIAELNSSLAIAGHYGATHRRLQVTGVRQETTGEFMGRNAFFVHAALLAVGLDMSQLAIGIHAGTPYRDCSPEFLREMQDSLDFHTGGRVTLSAPLLGLRKGDVVRLSKDLRVPLELTHSCDAADDPCETCPSCIERREVLAGP